jgi:hypothetical protein
LYLAIHDIPIVRTPKYLSPLTQTSAIRLQSQYNPARCLLNCPLTVVLPSMLQLSCMRFANLDFAYSFIFITRPTASPIRLLWFRVYQQTYIFTHLNFFDSGWRWRKLGPPKHCYHTTYHTVSQPEDHDDLYIRQRMRIIRGCMQKFPDLPPGARTANGTALCH